MLPDNPLQRIGFPPELAPDPVPEIDLESACGPPGSWSGNLLRDLLWVFSGSFFKLRRNLVLVLRHRAFAQRAVVKCFARVVKGDQFFGACWLLWCQRPLGKSKMPLARVALQNAGQYGRYKNILNV